MLQAALQTTDATIGASDLAAYFSPRITEQARALLPRIQDPGVARNTAEVVSAIEEAAAALAASGGEVKMIPPVRATLQANGSVNLEWLKRDLRVGFTIETDPGDSGWYLVTSRDLGDTGAYGPLSSRWIRDTVSRAFYFLSANS